jgi:hypothetical protein
VSMQSVMNGTLALGRAALEQMMTSTAEVFRKSKVSDGAGGQVDSYASVGTYECLFEVYPVRPVEREREPVIQAITTWQFIFKRDVVVSETDRIVTDGRTFEVVGHTTGTNSMVNHVICLEIL